MTGWRPRHASGWSPLRFARHSALGHRRGQTAALVAISAAITACAAFTPVYDRAMQQALVETLLSQTSAAETTVVVRSESLVTAGGATDALDPRDLQAMVPADVATLLGPPLLGRSASVTPLAGDLPPTGPLLWREGACAHLSLVSGTCPAAAGEILVSEADVETFDLALGSTSTVGSAIEGAPGVRLEVVGTYAPSVDAWWQGEKLVGISSISDGTDPSAAHDAWLTTEETFTAGPILRGETSQSGAAVRTSSTDVDDLFVLDDRVRELSREVRSNGRGLAVFTGVDDVTEDVRAQTRQAHRTVPLLMAPLAVLAVFVLWLVLAAATEQRRGALAVARLRGRGPVGAISLLLVELLPVLLLGVVPGAVAALLGGALARRMLPGTAPFETGPGFTVAVLIAVVAVVLTTVAAAVRVAREPLDGLLRSGRVASRRWALGALDAFVIAAVGTGVLAFVTGSLSGPFALLGPAMLALLAGLLLAHLTGPAASRVGGRLLRRGRLVTGVTLLEMGRRREMRVAIVVITVASALAVFALDAFVVGDRTRTSASEHVAGAPVVLGLGGHDIAGVREALDAVDPGGRRATPVVVAATTLAVVPDGFRTIALFPRGAPTDEQWRALAAPDRRPKELTGSRVSLTVRSGSDLRSRDAFGSVSPVTVSLVVTTSAGDRRSVPLGALPERGATAQIVGNVSECEGGCTVAAVEFQGSPGVTVSGEVDLVETRIDGRLADWWSSADDWNTTETDNTLIRPVAAARSGGLRLELNLRGLYPVELTPAWVPQTVPAILPTARRDALGLDLTGVDGSDRPASSAGRITLIPTMPARSALVDLDAISRGAEFTHDSHAEVWLVDDPDLVASVTAALGERGILVTGVRRLATVRESYDDTVATWSLALGVVVGPVVLLLALLVLLVLVVTGWRERARELAILRLNGGSRRTTRRLAVWAHVPAILLGVAAGVSAGVAGAALAMPDVSFFPIPPEVPVVDTAISWPAVAVVAATCAVLLPSAAALAGRAVARRAHLSRVRETP